MLRRSRRTVGADGRVAAAIRILDEEVRRVGARRQRDGDDVVQFIVARSALAHRLHGRDGVVLASRHRHVTATATTTIDDSEALLSDSEKSEK